MKETTFSIPGAVIAAMLMAGIDSYDWLTKEIIGKCYERILRASGFEPLKEAKGAGQAIVAPTPYARILKIYQGSLRLDPFEDFSKFYSLEVYVPDFTPARGEDKAREELMTQELLIEINRRVFGLLNSLTNREVEVLRKRILEHKSITQTSSEMKIKPQAVVAFMASIKKRVDQHLYRDQAAG